MSTDLKSYQETASILLCRAGEILSDGDLSPRDEKYFRREYARLSKIVLPDEYRQMRRDRNAATNVHMQKLLESKPCPACGHKLVQIRSGSKVCKCVNCGTRFKAKRAKREKGK